MIDGIQLKVCGLTSLADADFAVASGADFLGFNFYPKSPRYLSLDRYRAMAGGLPRDRAVAVAVEPEAAALQAMADAGFDRYQIHFRHDIPISAIEAWSKAAGPEKLWLAPKLPPGTDIPLAWLGLAKGVLLDTFDESLFGGTGRTGDWPKFRKHREGHGGTAWILSGGLNPGNVEGALVGTGAQFLDVNSGIETSPGVKDHAKLTAFVAAVRRAAAR
jgi:phosphoribosylanthranilate isomerase